MSDRDESTNPHTVPIKSTNFSDATNAEIRRAAATGIYDIRGGGAKRVVPSAPCLMSVQKKSAVS